MPPGFPRALQELQVLGELRLGVEAGAGVVEVDVAAGAQARVLPAPELVEDGRVGAPPGGAQDACRGLTSIAVSTGRSSETETRHVCSACSASSRACASSVGSVSSSSRSSSLQRLGGSIGIPAAARSVLLLGRDPDDPHGARRVLAHVKNNMAAPVPSLAFELESVQLPGSGIETVRTIDAGISPHHAADLLSIEGRQRGSKLADAIAFLEEQLEEAPQPASELAASAKRLGISESTLKRAKEECGVKSEKSGFGAGWLWFLPNTQHGEVKAA